MSRQSERKRIRHKVVEILKKAQIPSVGESVFSQRSIDTDQEELPAINLYTLSESSERENESPKTYQRNLTLEIEITSTHDNDELLADELDDLAQFVEDVMEGSDDLYNLTHGNSKDKLINDYNLINTEYETQGNGSNPIGKVKLSYAFEYYTDEDRPGILKNFERMETQYNVNGSTDSDAKEISEFETGDNQ